MSQSDSSKLGWKEKIRKEVISWTIMIVAVVFIRSTLFGMYEIPSGSMLPTIRIGDRIFANKLAYGLWLPFADKQLVTWQTPVRGDVVLFQSRTDSNTLIKRVVGVGGDEIRFQDGRMVINGKPQKEIETPNLAVPDETRFPVNAYAEELDGSGFEHAVFRARFESRTVMDGSSYVVPPGYVFCMGDNRDDSNDSRFWGPVPVNEIFARGVAFVYSVRMPDEGFVPTVRWERFFRWLR